MWIFDLPRTHAILPSMLSRPLILTLLLQAICFTMPSTAALAQETPPKFTNTLGMELTLIPAGEFLMGASEEEIAAMMKEFPDARLEWFEGEMPRHKVRITKPFYMDTHETTLGQFLVFYHEAKYRLDAERDGREAWGYKDGKLIKSQQFRPWNTGFEQTKEQPVSYVSWNDAVAFCNWLSKREGRTYRLPTEAEWEYACRAGTDTIFNFGNSATDFHRHANGADATLAERLPKAELALFDQNAGEIVYRRFPFLPAADGHAATAPVGRFLPNAFGLYDMHGNVSEWCSDFYHELYYAQSPDVDPQGPESGSVHIFRGGGFFTPAVVSRSSARDVDQAYYRHYNGGFRVVCEP